MKIHFASVHVKKKPFKCYICEYSFSKTSSIFKIHIKSVHEEKKPFKCDICDNSCSQKIRQSIQYHSLYIISSCATTPSASSLFLSYQTAIALGCTSFTALSLFPEAIKIWNSIFFCVPAASACALLLLCGMGGGALCFIKGFYVDIDIL